MQHERSLAGGTIVLLLVGVLLAALVVMLVVRHRAATHERGSAAASTLSDTEMTPYTDLDGNPFTFTTYRNKIRVVNVWASWSPYTADEFPILERIAADYADRNVVVIAINRKEPLERIEAYLRQLGTYDTIVPVVDLTDAYYRSVGGYAMPETVVYDDTGNIVAHLRGVLTEDALRSILEQLTGF